MSIVKVGSGLTMNQTKTWVEGEEITVSEISLAGVPSDSQYTLAYSPSSIGYNIGQPGDILTIDKSGNASWSNPMEIVSDRELRKEYPPLEDAWQLLMEALSEYQLVKKLVQDHDK